MKQIVIHKKPGVRRLLAHQTLIQVVYDTGAGRPRPFKSLFIGATDPQFDFGRIAGWCCGSMVIGRLNAPAGLACS